MVTPIQPSFSSPLARQSVGKKASLNAHVSKLRFGVLSKPVEDRFKRIQELTYSQLVDAQLKADKAVLDSIKRSIGYFNEHQKKNLERRDALQQLQKEIIAIEEANDLTTDLFKLRQLNSRIKELRKENDASEQSQKLVNEAIIERIPKLKRVESLEALIEFIANPECAYSDNFFHWGPKLADVIAECLLDRRTEQFDHIL